jgi:hypothetical protein
MALNLIINFVYHKLTRVSFLPVKKRKLDKSLLFAQSGRERTNARVNFRFGNGEMALSRFLPDFNILLSFNLLVHKEKLYTK